MGFFSNWPYSNLHNLNLDWVISKMKDISDMCAKIWERVKPVEGGDTSTVTAAQAYGHATDALDTATAAGKNAQKANADIAAHVDNKNNPHNVTAAQVGAEPRITLLPMSKGGTGAFDAGTARANLDARKDFAILPVTDGGTGSSTAAGARSALGVTPINIGAEPTISVLDIARGGTGANSIYSIQNNFKMHINNEITASDKADWTTKARAVIMDAVQTANGVVCGNVGWKNNNFCSFIAWRIFKDGEYDRCVAFLFGSGDLTNSKIVGWENQGNNNWREITFNSGN